MVLAFVGDSTMSSLCAMRVPTHTAHTYIWSSPRLPLVYTDSVMERTLRSVREREILALVLLALAFIGVSIFADVHRAALASVIAQGSVFGVAAYVLLTALFVVFIIPLDLVLLIPIGVVVWGPVWTALLSILGWTLGAAVAFGVARRFGAPVVGRFVPLDRVRAVERRLPRGNRFSMVVFFRMLVSVDLLSYALGLFSDMPLGQYVLATALGVAPFGFYFAYAGALPLAYRIAAILSALALATFVIVRYGVPREP
ncbi:MAG: hypothetical protein B7W98_02095 [Parcubacteria group bacterium 20-58-5]|nr:MAG: hypothetical protein B7W98_02095 [Parcubacteria group bacterium 20-58-5]